MTDSDQQTSQPVRHRAIDRGLHLATIAGIQIRLDSSLLLIFLLVVYLLGATVFPGWHPDWSGTTRWLTATAAGLLFFTSVLLHELAFKIINLFDGDLIGHSQVGSQIRNCDFAIIGRIRRIAFDDGLRQCLERFSR